MKKSLVIFTFSPIQPFISEARRPADLYAGSRILSEIASTAASVFQKYGMLVYPSKPGKDTPNKLVAIINESDLENALKSAQSEFAACWNKIAKESKDAFLKATKKYPIDNEWEMIWKRQVDGFPWEIFWTAQEMDDTLSEDEAYRLAYPQAEKGLNAVKRLRRFDPANPEPGQKDSLSGTRQGLQTKNDSNSRLYWQAVASLPSITPSQIRPGERLDSIGLIKRFWPAGFNGRGFLGFPSTSSIASMIYLKNCSNNHSEQLKSYREKVDKFKLTVVSQNPNWPYDGDYLYPGSLDDLMGVNPSDLSDAKNDLKLLHKVAGEPPTYYVVVSMDGDSMGASINKAIMQTHPINSHQEFSRSITDFSSGVPTILDSFNAFSVYAGGEDVLFLSPLDDALEAACRLSEEFKNQTKSTISSTCSAGVAIIHHTSPLGAALRIARDAEHAAKEYKTIKGEKNAICIHAVKRSGEELQVCAQWDDIQNYVTEIRDLFRLGVISSRFAGELNRSIQFLPANGSMVRSEVNRLISRHQDKQSPRKIDAASWAQLLEKWAQELPGGIKEVSLWILLARFLAKGGDR